MAGYYYNDDNQNNRNRNRLRGPVFLSVLIGSIAVLAILLVVLASNNSTSGKRNFENNQMLNPNVDNSKPETALDVANAYTDANGNKDIEKLYRDNKLRAEDLDFWNMYSRDRSTPRNDNVINDENNEDNSNQTPEPSQTPSAEPTSSPEDELIDGVKQNNLEYTNIRIVDDKLGYFVDGVEMSYLGVELSEDSGVVDFGMLKNQGIKFVMLKVGQRGYDSGVMTLDSNFERNIKAAEEAALEIGLYFSSRAVTVNEAAEEARFCLENMRGYNVKYPIAFVYEGQLFDSARTDILEKEDKTKIADTFMNTILSSGNTPILYGSKEYILEELVPEKLLKTYDVWLYDQDPMTTYPYQFKIWKYKNSITIPGVEKPSAYLVSFVNYSNR